MKNKWIGNLGMTWAIITYLLYFIPILNWIFFIIGFVCSTYGVIIEKNNNSYYGLTLSLVNYIILSNCFNI